MDVIIFIEHGAATRSRAAKERKSHPARKIVQVRGRIGSPPIPLA